MLLFTKKTTHLSLMCAMCCYACSKGCTIKHILKKGILYMYQGTICIFVIPACVTSNCCDNYLVSVFELSNRVITVFSDDERKNLETELCNWNFLFWAHAKSIQLQLATFNATDAQSWRNPWDGMNIIRLKGCGVHTTFSLCSGP